MRKGFLASVAALATSAGVACGQGSPAAPAGAALPVPGMGAAMPASSPDFLPTGMRGGAPLPPAGPHEMPHTGPVIQNGPYDPWAHGPEYNPEARTNPNGQVHKAAGGPDRFYLDLENLAWRPKAMRLNVPLATASPAANGGVLGIDGTRVLYGNNDIDYGSYINVFRLTGGLWDSCRRWGIEASGFIQEQKSELADFYAPIGGREALARPAIDALTGQAIAVLVGFPGQFSGEVHIRSTLKMGGAEANVMRNLLYCDTIKLNLLGGIRYIDHDETLRVISRTLFPNNPDPAFPPDIVDISDEFAVRNQFLGGQLGVHGELRCNRVFLDFTGKCAVGNMNEQLDIQGFTNQFVGGVTTTSRGGLLALDSNIARRDRDRFAVVPELTAKLGYQWTQRISSYIGYNFLYINHLLRPADQIDPVVNPTLIPVSPQFGIPFGPARPQAAFNESSFWTHGVTFGFSIRY